MGRKTPEWPPYPKWTTARWWTFLRSGLRALSRKWPVLHECSENAKRPSQSENKKLKWEYQCNGCKKWYPQKEVAVDHIEPAGALKSYDDIVPFIQRLFCPLDNLQVLCTTCHDKKTKEEKRKDV